MTQAIVIAHAEDDWMGVYKGGHLVYQGRQIEPSRLLQIIGISHTDYHGVPIEPGDLFPRTLREVPGFGG